MHLARCLALASILATSAGCYDEIAVASDADMTCHYFTGRANAVVFSGGLTLRGTGLEIIYDYLCGHWTFYRTPEERENARFSCTITLPECEDDE